MNFQPSNLHLNQLPPEPPAEPIQNQEPAPQPTQESETVSLNDFISDVHQPAKLSADSAVNEDTGEVEITTTLPEGSGKPDLTDNEAEVNTEILMSMRESAQAFGLSYYVDGTLKDWEKYKYPTDQKRNLIRAWSRIIQAAGIRVSPWMDVVQAELFATGPIVALAFTSRRQRLTIEKQAAEIARLQKENAEFSSTVNTKAAGIRSDSKAGWKIDEKGFFEFTPAGSYIKKDQRREKAEPTPENYQLLVKHNGKEFTDRALNIQA